MVATRVGRGRLVQYSTGTGAGTGAGGGAGEVR